VDLKKIQNPENLKSIITTCFFSALSLTHLSSAQQEQFPFTATTPSFSSGARQAPAFSNFTYTIQNNKILLSWTIGKNENTDRFELERSSDGKKFVVAALLFGTDKPGENSYQLYEKTRPGKIFYRVKIIHKDQGIGYSAIILTGKNQL
jgi:hypothetical protein